MVVMNANNQWRINALRCLFLLLMITLHYTQPHAVNKRKSRKRKADWLLPFHQKRERKLWSPYVRCLGSDLFRTHHRVSEALFKKIHRKIKKHISTESKYARKSCCRGDVSHVDSRTRLAITLQHLGGSRTCDIASLHGVSRQTVGEAIRRTFDAIIKEFPIPPFPFNDESKLQRIADGFKAKSTGGLFDGVVGAIDGFLLRINKTCIGNKSGVNDPSKFYCRKKYYAINCQVVCDANRKVLALSMLCPGAVPDTIAHLKSAVHHGITTDQLPRQFYFVADGAYPPSDALLTPFNRTAVRADVGGSKDDYNFYLSQLRINIECCFGMLINKFSILQSALKTPLLRNAVDTFVVCYILHNLCIDERLSNNDGCTFNNFPPGRRYTQVPRAQTTFLRRRSDFEYVATVDEVQAEDVALCNQRRDQLVTNTELGDEDANVSRVEHMLYKIARSGYVRPRARM